ncbi:hypothetical protein [Pseudonocardia sp. 73-21]|uniref:hypothetical protein n=1 Tax=Pseudonocardia sp. 73-21 TaxID=1895809 RepID=UPI00095C9AC3|nr:hypothetical protein [Pseudonocardia sp. 73-21]OJY39009.1 MAG: hypothetical protein BGP03_02025 [Pseudonocardia sp. 73-21]
MGTSEASEGETNPARFAAADILVDVEILSATVTPDPDARTTRFSHISGIEFRSAGPPGIIDGRPHRGPRPPALSIQDVTTPSDRP